MNYSERVTRKFMQDIASFNFDPWAAANVVSEFNLETQAQLYAFVKNVLHNRAAQGSDRSSRAVSELDRGGWLP